MKEAKSLRYWYRKKYNLPSTDPRYLEMTDIEIEAEYLMAQYTTVLDEGREPSLDEFETVEVDKALEDWANEDDELLDVLKSRDDTGSWEEVNFDGN